MFRVPGFRNPIKKTCLGIDIGTASIKVVERSQSRGKAEMVNYGFLETQGHLERINNAIQTSSLEILDSEAVDILRTLLEKMHPATQDVAASLPAFSAFTSLLELPSLSAAETPPGHQT